MPFLRSSTRPQVVECFFCLSTSLLPPTAPDARGYQGAEGQVGTPFNWQCPKCNCWNVKDKVCIALPLELREICADIQRGEMISETPAMHDASLNEQSFSLRARPSRNHLPTAPGSSSSSTINQSPFCRNCLGNQTLIINLLANYLPSEDASPPQCQPCANVDDQDPTYIALEATLPSYLEGIHARYPPVCADCQPGVEEALRRAEAKSRSEVFSRALKRGSTPIKQDTSRWKSTWRWLTGSKPVPLSLVRPVEPPVQAVHPHNTPNIGITSLSLLDGPVKSPMTDDRRINPVFGMTSLGSDGYPGAVDQGEAETMDWEANDPPVSHNWNRFGTGRQRMFAQHEAVDTGLESLFAGLAPSDTRRLNTPSPQTFQSAPVPVHSFGQSDARSLSQPRLSLLIRALIAIALACRIPQLLIATHAKQYGSTNRLNRYDPPSMLDTVAAAIELCTTIFDLIFTSLSRQHTSRFFALGLIFISRIASMWTPLLLAWPDRGWEDDKEAISALLGLVVNIYHFVI